jgi:hypothetical protein
VVGEGGWVSCAVVQWCSGAVVQYYGWGVRLFLTRKQKIVITYPSYDEGAVCGRFTDQFLRLL